MLINFYINIYMNYKHGCVLCNMFVNFCIEFVLVIFEYIDLIDCNIKIF